MDIIELSKKLCVKCDGDKKLTITFPTKEQLDDHYENSFSSDYHVFCRKCLFYNINCTCDEYEKDEDENRGVVLYKDKYPEYELPEDLQKFYEYFDNIGPRFNSKILRKNIETKFNDPLFDKKLDHSLHFDFDLVSSNIPDILYANEWVCILDDAHSVDNGSGQVLVNCSRNSEHFGYILCCSSNDDRFIGECESFKEFMHTLYHSTLKKRISSIVDYTYGYYGCESGGESDESSDESDESDEDIMVKPAVNDE